MAVKVVDSVVETTQTTGTGTLDLDGAQTGFRSFAEELTSGDQVYYCIEDDPASPTAYEIGIGTFTAGSPNTLSRDTVLKSSNAGNKLNLVAGGYTVTGVLPAKALQAITDSLADYAKLETSNTFTADQTIQKSDDGSAAGPIFNLIRLSDNPEANDFLGQIRFIGQDLNGSSQIYAMLSPFISDPTAGAHAGAFRLLTAAAGSLAERIRFGAGVMLGGSIPGGDKGAGTLNAADLYINGTSIQSGMAKAWAVINVSSGTPSVAANLNVASITDNGVGSYTINWTTPFASTAYAVIATAHDATGGDVTTVSVTSRTASSVTISCYKQASGPVAVDPASVFIAAFGTLSS